MSEGRDVPIVWLPQGALNYEIYRKVMLGINY